MVVVVVVVRRRVLAGGGEGPATSAASLLSGASHRRESGGGGGWDGDWHLDLRDEVDATVRDVASSRHCRRGSNRSPSGGGWTQENRADRHCRELRLRDLKHHSKLFDILSHPRSGDGVLPPLKCSVWDG